MTKVMINVPEDGGDLFFEVDNHAGDIGVCAMASALANVMAIRAWKKGYDVEKYESGHVKIVIPIPDITTCHVAEAVQDAYMALADSFPDHVKVY